MESESGTNNTKISDSGCSHSCSNTTSKGSASSKSRHSNGSNSSGSSGYGGAPKPNESEVSNHSQPKCNKEHKKKNASCAISQTFALQEAPILEPEDKQASLLCVDKTSNEKANEELINYGAINEEPKIPDITTFSQPEVNDGFCCVISMYDGVVLYTTPSLTSVLGFPKEMWLGHSFIDFVHPKDRETFSNHINTGFGVSSMEKIKDIRNNLYVCLRRYVNVSQAGLNILEKSAQYQPFRLRLTMKQLTDSPENRLYDHNNGFFLVIIAVPVYSAYKVPMERKWPMKFGMRHSANCLFSHVDPDIVTNFGFLPQDMLGKSVFDFYHPEDMPLLKEIYLSVVKTGQTNGAVFRSKPFRFLIQNGCYAVIETEWSSVINPWSKGLEFIVSLHQVLQGPLNPNVFDSATDTEFRTIPQDVIRQGKVIQREIIQILTEPLLISEKPDKRDVSIRCKDLADIMESLMNTSRLEIDVAHEFNPSISERDSVMLGEISPHHDFCDSKSSSETLPSYNQLNYNENIHRFFQSNPKTIITSDESNSINNVMETDAKNSQVCAPDNQKCLSPLQNSGASGSGDSAGNLSSGSNPQLESGTTCGTNDGYKSRQLTEQVLVRHNEDMEKIMLQKHKKERSHIKDREAKKSHHIFEKHTNEIFKDDLNEHNHGVKRIGSNLWEQDRYTKHRRQNETTENVYSSDPVKLSENPCVDQLFTQINNGTRSETNRNQSDEIFPQFSVPLPPNPQISGQFAPMPFCYLPALVQPSRTVSNIVNPAQKYQVQYMPGIVYNYNPIVLPQQLIYSPMPIVPLSLHNSIKLASQNCNNTILNVNCGNRNQADNVAQTGKGGAQRLENGQQLNDTLQAVRSNEITQCDRPSSQATSVKAEPGSRIGSIASASVINTKGLSECSRKELGFQSVCSPDSPVSPPDGETQAEQFNMNVKIVEPVDKHPQQMETNYRKNRMDEESSWYSSSYSSLLKTDTTSGSNDDSTSNNNTNRTDEIVKRQRKTYPLRKKDPPWMESVSASSDLIFKYQLTMKNIDEILKTDLSILNKTEQPIMVNDQLHQLYIEMELEGLSKALTLEESFSSSSCSSEENPGNFNIKPVKRPRKQRSYSSLVMTYEEDAPLPPPDANS
ncbi:hypothetical protein ABEB36_013066 [Hypothenemus hampei]|uniref:Period circadian protein n=1 Tax=Hypothenemus hampei TaxID=57062 RepID=A0ABD1E705_HYPHA